MSIVSIPALSMLLTECNIRIISYLSSSNYLESLHHLSYNSFKTYPSYTGSYSAFGIVCPHCVLFWEVTCIPLLEKSCTILALLPFLSFASIPIAAVNFPSFPVSFIQKSYAHATYLTSFRSTAFLFPQKCKA